MEGFWKNGAAIWQPISIAFWTAMVDILIPLTHEEKESESSHYLKTVSPD